MSDATEQQDPGRLSGCQGDLGPAAAEAGKMAWLDDLPGKVGCTDEGDESVPEVGS